jgi:hypothetical protein
MLNPTFEPWKPSHLVTSRTAQNDYSGTIFKRANFSYEGEKRIAHKAAAAVNQQLKLIMLRARAKRF